MPVLILKPSREICRHSLIRWEMRKCALLNLQLVAVILRRHPQTTTKALHLSQQTSSNQLTIRPSHGPPFAGRAPFYIMKSLELAAKYVSYSVIWNAFITKCTADAPFARSLVFEKMANPCDGRMVTFIISLMYPYYGYNKKCVFKMALYTPS